MNILYFLDFPHCVGGSNKTTLKQAHIMSRRGNDVTVVIPDDADGKHAHEYDDLCGAYGLHAITARFTVAPYMETIDILRSMGQYGEIYKLIEKIAPELVCSTQINVTVELAARELRIPHLMNIYQADRDSFRDSWLDVHPHYHSSDSELFSKMWGSGLGIPSRCVRTAYEGSGRKAAAPRKNSGILYILSMGAVCERKNQLEIIKFVLKCKNSGVRTRLTFLGDYANSYGECCKKFVKENNLEDEVVFKGFVVDVDKYLDQSDLMVCASKVESYPGVIIESISRKIPVLSTPVAGVPELMKDGYNCLLTKGYQCDDIYEAFQRYLGYKKDNRIEGITDRAYETYEANHSYEAVGSELEKYYGWILENYDAQNVRMKISEAEEIFGRFLDGKDVDAIHPFTRDNIWFLYHINEKIKQKKPQKIAIWGAGFFGKIALEWISLLGCVEQFIGFFDMNEKGEYQSYPIFNDKERFINDCDIIFVAVGDMESRLDISDNLEKYGMKRNEDYFMLLNEPLRICRERKYA